MEPPPFGDGNMAPVSSSPPGTRAFNGATALRRWKPDCPRGSRSEEEPSMEPPPFGDGNVGYQLGRIDQEVLQWSHRPSAMETSQKQPGSPALHGPFNGATALRRWKRPWGCRRRGCYGTFNGATALRRWKRYYILNGATAFQPFNGATALRRWKPANASVC